MAADQIKAVEDRAFAARLTIEEMCKIARIAPSTWSRARKRGTIRVKTLRRAEEALDYVESRQAGEPRSAD